MSQLNVRINHKYDSYSAWMESTLILGKGEIAVAEIPTSGYPVEGDTSAKMTPPAIGIKIGDGGKKFSELPWIQSTAGDVYAWAKKAHLEYADLTEDFINELKQLVSGEVQDTNTTYQFSLTGDVLTINHKEKTDDDFSKLVDITLPFSTKMDKDTDAVEGNLAKFDANGNAVDAGEKISDYIKTADADTKYAAIALEETVSGIDERLGTAVAEIDDLQEAVETLNGTGEGSVQKKVDDAINKFATDVTDDGVVNKFKELVDWAAEHGSEAGEMAAAIQENADAIAQIEEDASKLEERVAANEEAIAKLDGADTVEGSVKQQIKAAKEDLEGQIGVVDGKAGQNAEDIAAIEETLNGKEGTPGVLADIDKLQEDLSNLDGEAIKEIDGVTATVAGNKATVSAVPVTLLQNVDGDTLVFNCGTSSTVI